MLLDIRKIESDDWLKINMANYLDVVEVDAAETHDAEIHCINLFGGIIKNMCIRIDMKIDFEGPYCPKVFERRIAHLVAANLPLPFGTFTMDVEAYMPRKLTVENIDRYITDKVDALTLARGVIVTMPLLGVEDPRTTIRGFNITKEHEEMAQAFNTLRWIYHSDKDSPQFKKEYRAVLHAYRDHIEGVE